MSLDKGPNKDRTQKFVNYGVGAAKVISSVADGLSGNPLGWVNAAEHFGGMVKDKVDGRI